MAYRQHRITFPLPSLSLPCPSPLAFILSMEQYASELVLSFGPRGSLAAACRRLPTLSYTGSRGHRNAVAVIHSGPCYYKYWVLTIHHYPPISMHTAYILETQIYINMTGLPQRSQSSRPLMVHYIWRHYHWPWLVGCPEGGQVEEDPLIHHCPRPRHVILPRVWRKLCRKREREKRGKGGKRGRGEGGRGRSIIINPAVFLRG